MSKQDCIQVEGTVVEDLSNSRFKVELDNGIMVNCVISGKIRQRNIRIMISDRVVVELSIYDTTQGRISYRLTGNENKKVLDKDKKKNNNNKKTVFKKK